MNYLQDAITFISSAPNMCLAVLLYSLGELDTPMTLLPGSGDGIELSMNSKNTKNVKAAICNTVMCYVVI